MEDDEDNVLFKDECSVRMYLLFFLERTPAVTVLQVLKYYISISDVHLSLLQHFLISVL